MASEVWAYFKIEKDNSSVAKCNLCLKLISRGGKSKTTSNLIKHLRVVHSIDLSSKNLVGSRNPTASSLDSFLKKEQTKSSTMDVDDNLREPKEDVPLARPNVSEGLKNIARPSTSADSSLSYPLFVDVEEKDEDVDDPQSAALTSPSETIPLAEVMSPKSSHSSLSPDLPNWTYPKFIKLGSRSHKQQTLPEIKDKASKFKLGDSRAIKIDTLVGEMICLDFQPISVVENKGFRRLINHLEPRYTIPSRKRMSDQILRDMYNKIYVKVRSNLSNANHVAITTDMWTSIAKEDYMSITAHFIQSNAGKLEVTYRCLEVAPFTEVSHTADNLKSFLIHELENWGIKEKVVAIVRDNGTDITAALGRSPFLAVPCAAHTLQLVVKDGFLDNNKISNIVKKAKKLVGNFKHSAKLTKVLKMCQRQLSLPIHRLIQDEPTRWNSTFHMLRRVNEQKNALILVAAKEKLSVELTADDWNTIQCAIEILEVFDTATQQLSKERSCISEIIPLIHTILHVLSTTAPPGSGLQGLRNDMVSSLMRRYPDIESTEIYALSTLLDPRFKSTPFKSEANLQAAKQIILGKMKEGIGK